MQWAFKYSCEEYKKGTWYFFKVSTDRKRNNINLITIKDTILSLLVSIILHRKNISLQRQLYRAEVFGHKII